MALFHNGYINENSLLIWHEEYKRKTKYLYYERHFAKLLGVNCFIRHCLIVRQNNSPLTPVDLKLWALGQPVSCLVNHSMFGGPQNDRVD